MQKGLSPLIPAPVIPTYPFPVPGYKTENLNSVLYYVYVSLHHELKEFSSAH